MGNLGAAYFTQEVWGGTGSSAGSFILLLDTMVYNSIPGCILNVSGEVTVPAGSYTVAGTAVWGTPLLSGTGPFPASSAKLSLFKNVTTAPVPLLGGPIGLAWATSSQIADGVVNNVTLTVEGFVSLANTSLLALKQSVSTTGDGAYGYFSLLPDAGPPTWSSLLITKIS